MGKKAIDVVLLPSDVVMDRAIEVNAELVREFGKRIVLNKEDCLPHISLAMGCVDENDIGIVEQVLKTIAKNYPPVELKITGIRISGNSVGEKVSAFVVEKTKVVQLLHEEVIRGLERYLSYYVTVDMINAEDVAESTLLWIKNYREKSSFGSFRPHITVGYGETEMEEQLFPIGFRASRLALCHLGNHCTCSKVLASVIL